MFRKKIRNTKNTPGLSLFLVMACWVDFWWCATWWGHFSVSHHAKFTYECKQTLMQQWGHCLLYFMASGNKWQLTTFFFMCLASEEYPWWLSNRYSAPWFGGSGLASTGVKGQSAPSGQKKLAKNQEKVKEKGKTAIIYFFSPCMPLLTGRAGYAILTEGHMRPVPTKWETSHKIPFPNYNQIHVV